VNVSLATNATSKPNVRRIPMPDKTETTVTADSTSQAGGAGAGAAAKADGSQGAGKAAATNASATKETLLGGAGEGDKGAQEETEGGEKKGEAGAPAELKIELPEGVVADKETLSWFKDVATEKKLTSEQATAVAAGFVALQEKQRQALDVQQKDWEQTLVNDPEIGGQKWAESKQTALNAVKRFAHGGFVDLLNETGLGSHPDVVRTFIAIGKAIQEDNNASSRAGAGQPAQLTEKELNDVRFPSSKDVGR
jgi:hypothetical protein